MYVSVHLHSQQAKGLIPVLLNHSASESTHISANALLYWIFINSLHQ